MFYHGKQRLMPVGVRLRAPEANTGIRRTDIDDVLVTHEEQVVRMNRGFDARKSGVS